MKSWPLRRWVIATLAAPAVGLLLLSAGGTAGATARPTPAFYALTSVAAVLGGLIAASYVPVAGRGIDVGCSPCAVMAGVTVIGATVAMNNYGTSLLGPLVAAAVMLFGLTQRLGQPATCATPRAGGD
jgi:hypothetical protein